MRRLAILLAAAATLSAGAVASAPVLAPVQDAAPAGKPVPAPVPTPGDAAAQTAWEASQKAYLDWNGAQRGWRKTDTGVQARRTSSAGSGRYPKATDTVTIHYVGTLINGTEFNSSRRRGVPATFPLPQLIKGWQSGVPLMRKGETWEFVIPADQAYGPRARANIPGNSTLLFTIELIDFQG